jgi:hypothetical protein
MTEERRLTPFWLGAHGYTWALFLFFLGFAAPIAQEMFADYGIPLPRLTSFVFDACRLLVWPLPAVVAVPLVLVTLLCVDWLVLNSYGRRGEDGLALAWSMLMFACPLCLIALTVLALVLPLLSILRLSG